MAIQCPSCGRWQGKILYTDIKKATFKCMICRKTKKLVSKAKLTVNAKVCDSYQEMTLTVNQNNLPKEYKI